MENESLRERIGLMAESMLPPIPPGKIRLYKAAAVMALLLSSLSVIPVF